MMGLNGLTNFPGLISFLGRKCSGMLFRRRHPRAALLFNGSWLVTDNDVRSRDPPAYVLHPRCVKVCCSLNSKIPIHDINNFANFFVQYFLVVVGRSQYPAVECFQRARKSLFHKWPTSRTWDTS